MAMEAVQQVPAPEPVATPRRPHLFWRVIRRPGGAFGIVVLIILLVLAITADWIAPYVPTKVATGPRFSPAFGRFLLGTDDLGRDLLSRLIYGARLTVLVASVAVGISMTIGVTIGLVAAYARGIVEMILMRSADVIFSFTETLIALACVAVLGPSLENAVIAVGIAGIPYYARTTYASALVETSKPYFEGAAAAGAGPFRLILVHLLPNVIPTIVVVATLGISIAILAAAALSFLGLGAQPPQPEWGKMLSDARDFFNRAPWLMLAPGICIAVTVLAFNLLGDALREALDPEVDPVTAPLLSVRGLSVSFGATPALIDFFYEIMPGETVALVGESGSGKSVSALAVMGLLPPRVATISGGAILFDGVDVLTLSPEERRNLRGPRMGMVFQEQMTSLNPVLTIGTQMTEGLIQHRGLSHDAARSAAIDMMERVGLSEPARRLRQYPHEFSGGMRQRAMIAMAMVLKPALLIADEPTTALDVSIQAQILALMTELTREVGTSLVLITHDMGVVAETADRVVVLRHGRMVETATARALFAAPTALYTRQLLAAVPRLDGAGPPAAADRPSDPVLRFDAVSKTFRSGFFGRGHKVTALDAVSLDVEAGETVAVVGESGSGKSTLGRVATRLTNADSGSVYVAGEDVTRLRGRHLRAVRATIQMVFQDPYSSLDPRRTAAQAIAEPMVILGRRAGSRDRAADLMERVGLSRSMLNRLPHQFSGGQRQRIAIARALATGPKIIVADEPTSALDVSVQAQVLDLLAKLQAEEGLALLFISHDLAVVRRIAHRIAVMRAGRIVELGSAEDILAHPGHPYTKALLEAAPVPDPSRRGRLRDVAPPNAPAGPLIEIAPRHWVAV